MTKAFKLLREVSIALAVFVCALIIAAGVTGASVATAGETVFARDYTYNASDADSKLSSRAIAMEQVKRILLEELGTYIKSETVIKNAELTKDEVTMLTAGVVRTDIVEEKWNGETYYIKVEIVADPDSIAESIKELVAEKVSLDDLKDSLAQRDEALEEVARLRAELDAARAAIAVAKTEGKDTSEDASKVKDLQKQYIGETEKMTAYSLWEQGYALFNKHKYEEALEYFDRAIEMNPNMARAYGKRGAVYNRTGLYEKALADFNKGIEIKPMAAKQYFGRWFAYKKLGEKKKAKADLKKSAELGYWKAKLKLSKKRGNII